MPHYDVSSHLRTIANIWEHRTGDDADHRYLLDGDGPQAAALYEAAEALSKAMQDYALPDAVDLDCLPPWPRGEHCGRYCDSVLALMTNLRAGDDDEDIAYPVTEFCERYGLAARDVRLADDNTDTGKACRLLEDQGHGDGILRVWRPPYERGEVCILREIDPDDGPYVVFAREKGAEPEPAP